MKNKRIVSCAITGSIHVPSLSIYLPLTPEKIAQEALDAAEAGAAVVHIHARDPKNGRPSADLKLFEQIVNTIRSKNKDVIICLTTGGSLDMTIEQRAAVIPALKPELASMNAGSINWGLFPLVNKIKEWRFDWEKPWLEWTSNAIFQNTFQQMMDMLRFFNKNGTKPELECYDVGHIYNVKWLLDNGHIVGKPYLQFVMGINGAIQANIDELVHMKQTADRVFGVGNYHWSAFGAGRMEFPICCTNLFLGGHVRVGLEDNLYLAKGVLAKSNAELVTKMVRLMRELDFEPATPDEARVILGLKKA
ncbi:MAG: 3-keto-5-aminohexanoate cleavage protein [Bacilli bacterium]|jgi:uncharacterized protein (DUF849 family)